MALTVYNPISQVQPDGTTLQNWLAGHQGEEITAEIHGQHWHANMRKNLFTFSVGPTVIATPSSGASCTCAIYNPLQSGNLVELVSVNLGTNAAQAAYTTFAWYTATQAQIAGSTFTTAAVAGTNLFSGRVTETPNNQAIPYSAIVPSSGLVLSRVQDIIGHVYGIGASATGVGTVEKYYQGRLIVPPGGAIFLMSTAAATASAFAQVQWAEWPIEA